MKSPLAVHFQRDGCFFPWTDCDIFFPFFLFFLPPTRLFNASASKGARPPRASAKIQTQRFSLDRGTSSFIIIIVVFGRSRFTTPFHQLHASCTPLASNPHSLPIMKVRLCRSTKRSSYLPGADALSAITVFPRHPRHDLLPAHFVGSKSTRISFR